MSDQEEPSMEEERGPAHFGYGANRWTRSVTTRADAASDRADDSKLRTLVRDALAALGETDGVVVTVQDDAVTLSGHVADAALKLRVENEVAGIAGVSGVENQLEVRPVAA